MLRNIVLAAFAAVFTSNTSVASEFSLPHVMVVGQTPSELNRQIDRCRVVEQVFGGSDQVKLHLSQLNKAWQEAGNLLLEQKAELLLEMGVPHECLFSSTASYPEGFEENHLVVRTSMADFFTVTWEDGGTVVSWDEMREAGEHIFYSHFDPVQLPYDPHSVSRLIVNGGQSLQIFATEPSFENHQVVLQQASGETPVQLGSGDRLWSFRTHLETAAEGPANFAGHYVLTWVSSGAGGGNRPFLIDKLTGEIYTAPELSVHWEFQMDSNLLVTGLPHPEDPGYTPDWLVTKHYTWDDSQKEWQLIFWKNPVATTGSIN